MTADSLTSTARNDNGPAGLYPTIGNLHSSHVEVHDQNGPEDYAVARPGAGVHVHCGCLHNRTGAFVPAPGEVQGQTARSQCLPSPDIQLEFASDAACGTTSEQEFSGPVKFDVRLSHKK